MAFGSFSRGTTYSESFFSKKNKNLHNNRLYNIFLRNNSFFQLLQNYQAPNTSFMESVSHFMDPLYLESHMADLKRLEHSPRIVIQQEGIARGIVGVLCHKYPHAGNDLSRE